MGFGWAEKVIALVWVNRKMTELGTVYYKQYSATGRDYKEPREWPRKVSFPRPSPGTFVSRRKDV